MRANIAHMPHEILIFEDGVPPKYCQLALIWCAFLQISVVFYISIVLVCMDHIMRNLLSRKHLNRLQYLEETAQAGHRFSLLYRVFDFGSIIMTSQQKVDFTRHICEFYTSKWDYQHTQSFHTVLSRAFGYICSQLFETVAFPKIPALPFSLPPECWSAAMADSKAVPAMWRTLQSWTCV